MLNENEVLDIMKNDLYQANERIRELEQAIRECIVFAERCMDCNQTYTSTAILLKQLKNTLEKK